MKKRKIISLMTMSMMLLTGCGEDSSSISDSTDNRDSQIVAIYDAYKANGGTLDYDTWLLTIKGEKGDAGEQGPKGDKGDKGDAGKGISSVIQSGVEGNKVTYTIIYTDGSTSNFTMTNGSDGHTPVITINSDGYWCIDGSSLGIKAKGDSGTDGRGISSIVSSYDENGNTLVTIIYTDGTNQTVTIKKGEKGDTGDKGMDGSSLISGKGAPSSDVGHDGDSYVDTDTWDYYIKSNGSWVLNGNIKGSKGDKGETGETGPKGDKGDTGETGSKGEKGDAGDKGMDGSSLISGKGAPSSDVGHDGDSYVDTDTWDYYIKSNGSWVLNGNIKGSKGDKGETGETGPKGDKGDTGEAGSKGEKGDVGEKGDTGAQGPKGDKGDTGDKGDAGKDGITYVPCIFKNWDGTKIYEFYYEKGSDIVYDGPEPTKEDTIEGGNAIHWTFKGWDKSLENVQAPTIFTAQYQCLYHCTFVNWDGSTLYETDVNRGESVEYRGETPTRPSEVSGDRTIDWQFIGWSASLNNITSDMTFRAQFNAPNAIKCTFVDANGTVLDTQYVGKNVDVTFNGTTPTKDDVNDNGVITRYTFSGWDSSLQGITRDTIFTAQYTESFLYECRFYNYDNTLLFTKEYAYGSKIDYYTYYNEPKRDLTVDGNIVTEYTFRNWDKIPIYTSYEVTAPTDFVAEYDSVSYTGYKVTFLNDDGSELYSHYFKEGTGAACPMRMPWDYDDEKVHMFVGWDQDISSVTKEMTVRPTFKDIPREKNGEYPQTQVTDENLIDNLDRVIDKDEQGYYVYNNEKYAKKGYYYYKVEPIQWRYLSKKNGQTLVVSEYSLDEHVWNETAHKDAYMNNYAESDVRKWLNNEFLSTAFLDDSLIETTAVDNSVASTGYESKPYVCETTNDKVFLLSYAEATNTANGFAYSEGNDINRVAFMTDYASGGYYGGKPDDWWLRSPGCSSVSGVYDVCSDGHLFSLVSCGNYFGIRPAIILKI